MEKEITLVLTQEEVNYALTALGRMPFIEVQHLIIKIQNQGNKQLEEESKKENLERIK